MNPNFYYWYILMKQFSNSTVMKWISDELYHDQDDSVITEFTKLYSCKKENCTESGELTSSEAKSTKP